MTARDHNNLLGIFFLIQGGLMAFVGVILAVVYGGVGLVMIGAGHKQQDAVVGGFMMVIGLCVAFCVVLLAIVYLFTGFKLRKQAGIGRTLGIVLSILSLFSFPLGTALGIYGLWFLFGDMGKALYLGDAAPAAGGYRSPQAPPPNSWQ